MGFCFCFLGFVSSRMPRQLSGSIRYNVTDVAVSHALSLFGVFGRNSTDRIPSLILGQSVHVGHGLMVHGWLFQVGEGY